MQVVPTRAEPYQKLTISLGGQACQIALRQEWFGLFMDLYVNNEQIILGVLCQSENRIVRDTYLGFLGDFAFVDNQGNSDPDYLGLGTRFDLMYIEASELPAEVG